MAPRAVSPSVPALPAAPDASATAPLPLVRRHPALAAIPRIPLVAAPTPIEPLRLAGVPDGALFVKRDDRSSPLYGGNKPRKLEFTLAAAAARGARRLVTTGGIGTHHGLATALFGRTLGMRTTVVVVPQPVTAHVRHQVRALRAYGAELLPARGVATAAVQVVRAFAAAWARGERPFWVPTGGSSALADVGFVSAACELADQIEAGLVPTPGELYVPVGSGGTLAGLALGLRLAGLQIHLVGVLVTDILAPGAARLARLANATAALLRRHDPTIPSSLHVGPTDFEITRAQLGGGYGASTAAAESAARDAAAAGLALETTYTAKCLAEVVGRLRSGRARGPVLFWNTYNSVDVLAAAPAAPPEAMLPAAIRRWLAEVGP